MIQIKAPTKFEKSFHGSKYVFLAGSIDMGNAEDWQAKLVKEFEGENVVFLNPRRDDWDSSWKQDKDDPQFREQVEWELHSMERADLIVMHLTPGSVSPISMLEFGLWALTKKIVVLCPEGFGRKGNIDLVCERYRTRQVHTWDELVKEIRMKLE